MAHQLRFSPENQNYQCAYCGIKGHQLWHTLNSLINPELLCAACLNSELDEKQLLESELNRHNVECLVLGWFTPAIPISCEKKHCSIRHVLHFDQITQDMMTWWHTQKEARKTHPQEKFFE